MYLRLCIDGSDDLIHSRLVTTHAHRSLSLARLSYDLHLSFVARYPKPRPTRSNATSTKRHLSIPLLHPSSLQASNSLTIIKYFQTVVSWTACSLGTLMIIIPTFFPL
ncbi:hypothetical protein JAAARDRAFT_157558 [Jaapia argillacea MUCL 33604]|uniref:Uncharacterized protein n=1 Tax=Jaapia argillacea MUCL 33604 TaxID=933084 RepID=A0A067PRE9_9AGAM|nr:hypothetical protein JAAARDRAFT_157558 [Jaapia argillacea MUCL 33604]